MCTVCDADLRQIESPKADGYLRLLGVAILPHRMACTREDPAPME